MQGRPPSRTLAYLLEAPFRRPGIVLLPVVLGTLISVAVASLLPVRYRASALVGAEWDASDEAILQQRGVDVAARRDQAVRQRVTDRALLERVVAETLPYARQAGDKLGLDAQVERMLSDLRVRPIASSSFAIEFVHTSPATAALVPNTLARLLVDATDERPDRALRELEVRLDEARRVLKQKSEALARTKPTATSASSEETEATVPDEDVFAEKRTVAASLATARARAERLRQEVESAQRTGSASSPEANLARLKGQLTELRKRYTEEHPDVQKLRNQIQRLESSLPATSRGAPSPQAELRATELDIKALEAQLTELEARTSRVPAAPLRPPARDRVREQAVREQESARREYQALLEDWQRARAAASTSRGPITRFELLRAASVPDARETSSPALFALVGALAGLAIGLVGAVVAEYRVRGIKGPEDLAAILAVPLLATIPEVRKRDRRA
jgi:protein tyrosine kinase modulator